MLQILKVTHSSTSAAQTKHPTLSALLTSKLSPPLYESQSPQTLCQPKSATTSRQPQSTSRQPQSTSRQPQSTSRQPQSTSRQPQSTSRQPQPTSRQPQSTSRQPQSTSRQPQSTSRQPQSTSRQPQSATTPPHPQSADTLSHSVLSDLTQLTPCFKTLSRSPSPSNQPLMYSPISTPPNSPSHSCLCSPSQSIDGIPITTPFNLDYETPNTNCILNHDDLPPFLQEILPKHYSYIFEHIKIEVKNSHDLVCSATILIDIMSNSTATQWISAFQDYTKTTFRVTRGTNVKGKPCAIQDHKALSAQT